VSWGYLARGSLIISTILLAALASGCGGQSNTTSTGTAATAALRARQDALVVFSQALIADIPTRKPSAEARARLRSAEASGHVQARVVVGALHELISGAEAWRRSMEALPGTNTDLAPIRKNFSEAAAEEVRYWRGYLAFLLRWGARGTPDKHEAEQVEAHRKKVLSLNDATGPELVALPERLGGEAAFRGRIDVNRLKEELSSLRQATGS
jgi:hypothetical protein